MGKQYFRFFPKTPCIFRLQWAGLTKQIKCDFRNASPLIDGTGIRLRCDTHYQTAIVIPDSLTNNELK